MRSDIFNRNLPFILVAALFFILSQWDTSHTVMNILALLLILIVGIPHGAIDHLLYANTTGRSQRSFYIFYLGSMMAYAVLWMASPVIGLWSFILLSAYHFGQSQFSNHSAPIIFKRTLFLSWGLSILGALLYHHPEEIQRYFEWIPSLQGSAEMMTDSLFGYLSLGLGILVFLCMIYLFAIRKQDFKLLVNETLQFIGIHLVFYLFPLLPAFALYFALLHSWPVMREEYEFIKSRQSITKWSSFVKLLLPFTLFSFAGMALLFALFYFQWTEQPQVLLLFILIAVLTLPHSIVMEHFYDSFYADPA
ncbi:MAG TPA: Brp/Blh family beta-carotene 15,15'-dioxygenase [Saprospiraceae bacterium]|nr:Brp/Blh family beta-carotene 15,15'-dioxygenase [Saprospiraceae bacterium]